MTTSSFKMDWYFMATLFITLTSLSFVFTSCKEDPILVAQGKNASQYSSEVIDKWMTLQLRLMRNATGIPNQAFSRHFAYSGIAAYESLRPGLTGNKKWSDKWNGLSNLPVFQPSAKFYFPANVNAALAAINKSMFPNANAADKAAIDSLEEAFKNEFLLKENAAVVNLSVDFGKAVAIAVFNWAETDGYKNAGAPYTVKVGAGLWEPTAPAFGPPSTPYWGNNRTVVKESLKNVFVPGLPAYSAQPGSPFYNMVKEVYDASQVLTDEQKAMALYWRDVPGVTSPGHWISILQQVMKQKTTSLEEASVAYALTGSALNDVLIRCFQLKYQHLTVRPITYIRDVIGEEGWSPFIGTPPHPEYISNHSALSVASAVILEELFGKNQPFTDHTYDYMGMAPRNYASYMAIGLEAGLSRFYGGIHYKQSLDDGTEVGIRVAENILSR